MNQLLCQNCGHKQDEHSDFNNHACCANAGSSYNTICSCPSFRAAPKPEERGEKVLASGSTDEHFGDVRFDNAPQKTLKENPESWEEKIRQDYAGILSQEQIEATIRYWSNFIKEKKTQWEREARQQGYERGMDKGIKFTTIADKEVRAEARKKTIEEIEGIVAEIDIYSLTHEKWCDSLFGSERCNCDQSAAYWVMKEVVDAKGQIAKLKELK